MLAELPLRIFALRFVDDFADGFVGGGGPFGFESGLEAIQGQVGVDAFGLVVGVGDVFGEINQQDAPGGGIGDDVGGERDVLAAAGDGPDAGEFDGFGLVGE